MAHKSQGTFAQSDKLASKVQLATVGVVAVCIWRQCLWLVCVLWLYVSFSSPNWTLCLFFCVLHVVIHFFGDDSVIFHVAFGQCALILLCKPTFHPPMKVNYPLLLLKVREKRRIISFSETMMLFKSRWPRSPLRFLFIAAAIESIFNHFSNPFSFRTRSLRLKCRCKQAAGPTPNHRGRLFVH